MHRSFLVRLTIALAVIAFVFAVPGRSSAQSTIDLVVHYVEGTPAENEIAYDVSVYLSVVDSAGNPIKDLTPDALIVTEDSQKVDIENLDLSQQEPINIVLVMDTSGSMNGSPISAAKTAASNFVSRLESSDRVAVITFDNTVEIQIDFTTDQQAARNQISLIEAVPRAGTCLYDAAYQAIQMASTLPSGRRAVLLLTDGKDETLSGGICSTHTTEDVINLASQGGTRTPIYTLGMGSGLDTSNLKRLADLTGGRYLYSPDASQLDSLFLRLSDQLRSQYVLTYKSFSGPGAHTLAVSANYLSAQDSDTRNFLLPAMPTRVNFTSPAEGEEVSSVLQVAVSLSGQGETVDRVAFEIDGKAIGTDDTTPYEYQIDLAAYPAGDLNLTAIAYGSNNAELASKTITVTVVTEPDAVVPEPPPAEQFTFNPLILLGAVGIGGLLMVTVVIVAVFAVRRRRLEKARDEAWMKAQTYEGAPAAGLGEERTVDGWELSADALGVLIVESSDDPSMIGHRFEITKNLTTLGRSADNDFNFPKDSPVSRHHAEISEKKGGLYLREVRTTDSSGSPKPPTFGTFINDDQLGEDPVLLQTGDEIRLGKRVRLKFEASRKTLDTEALTYDGLMSSDDPDKTRDET